MSLIPSIRARVVGASFGIQAIIIGCMFGYGVFFKVLETELGWSRTLLSGASSVAFLVMGVLAYVGGRLNDRYGPRWVLSVTGVLTGVGYMLASQMNSPWQLLLYFGLFIGIGLSTHDVVTLSSIASWFEKRRGMMTGVVKSGTACGQMLVPILVTFLIAAYGWRQAMMFMGISVSVLLLLLAQAMRRPGSLDQMQPQKSQRSTRSEAAKTAAGVGVSLREARRSRTLWTLCIVQFCFFPSLMTVPLHLVAHATDLGMTTETAATVLALLGGISIVGRLSMGFSLDVIGGKRALLLCLVPLAISLIALRMVENPLYLYPIAIVYGIAHGGLFTVISPTVAEIFGMKAHGAIFGTILLFGTLGGAAGPLVAGMIFDQFGSYDLAFVGLAVLAIAGIAMALSIKPVVKIAVSQ